MLNNPIIPLRVRQSNTDLQPSRDLPDGAFTFIAEASNSRLDAYFTHMDRTTLENFERAGIAGVILLDSHDGRKLGVGYSAGAKLYQDESGEYRLEVLFYIVPGIKLGGVHSYASTDDYIRAIEAGIVRDVSVGFSGGKWICDICGREYFTGGCPHLLGLEYEIDLGDGPIQIKTATAEIRGAELSEVSLVFDGATPGAEIVDKAQRLIEAGQVTAVERQSLEVAYRTKFKEPPIKVAETQAADTAEGVKMGKQDHRDTEIESTDAAVETEITETAEAVDTVKAEIETTETEIDTVEAAEAIEPEAIEPEAAEVAEAAVDVDAAGDADEIMRAIKATSERNAAIAEAVAGSHNGIEAIGRLLDLVDGQQKEIERLVPLADMGQTYRADLIDQVVKEGIRAQGNAFPEETYRLMLKSASIDHIKNVLDSFKGIAGERYPGGRVSEAVDFTDNGGNSAAKNAPEVPARAYGA